MSRRDLAGPVPMIPMPLDSPDVQKGEVFVTEAMIKPTSQKFIARPQNQPAVMHIAPGYWACDPRLYHLECSFLKASGFSVEFAAHELPTDQLDPRIKFHSLGSYGNPTLAWRLLGRALRDRTAYALARRSTVALYHFHSVEFIPWGCRLRRVTGRPVVFDCREDFVGYARQRRGIPEMLRPLLAKLVRSQLRRAAQSCDAIIVADEGTAKIFQPHAKRSDRLTQLPSDGFIPGAERIIAR